MVKFAPFDWIVSSDDDFLVKCHKFIITVFCYFLSPVALVAIGVFTTFAATSSPSPSRSTVVGLMGSIATFIFCTVPWLYLRRCKVKKVLNKWTSTHTHAWLLSASILTHVIAITVNVPSLSLSYATTGFCIGICDPTKRKIHLYVLAFFLLWFEYNQDVYLAGYTSLDLRILGSEEYRILRPVCAILSPVWYGLCVGGLVLIVKEYNKSNEKAKNSVSLCYAVSEKLLSYDIQSAQQLLQEGGGEVDVRLRTALLQMVSNLELFRPHLPEYVWDIVRKRVLLDDLPEYSLSNSNTAHTTEDAGSNKVPLQPLVLGPAAQREKSTSTTSSSSSTSPAANKNGRKGKPKDAVIVDSASETIPSPALLEIVNSGPGGGGVTRNNVDDVMPNFVPPTFTAGSLFEFLPETVNHVHYGMIDFTRRLTGEDILLGEDAIMPIDVVGADVASETTTPGPDSCLPRPASVRKLVNWAHSQALLSRGTLHSFVGDTIHATWCFRAPSAKPVVFLTKLYKTFNGDPSVGLNIGGVVVSGKGTSYMAGDRRQAYVLHIPWRDQVTQYFTIARENRAALICENTFSGSHKVINCRWIDVVPKLEGVMTSRSLAIQYSKVYEVLGLRGAGQDMSYDDVVASDVMAESSDDQQRRDSHDSFTTSNTSSSEETNVLMDAVSVSLEECVRGYYSDAKRYLGRDPRFLKGLSYSTMLDRLQRKIDKAMEDNVTGEMFCFV
eukprot:PhF_6_TR39678/c2_g1_i4/m.58940